MKPTYAELALELQQTKAELVQTKDLLRKALEEINKLCSEVVKEQINKNSNFGPKLMGLLVTLTGVFHLAKREAVELIKELYGIDMGIGSVSNIEERISEALDPIYQRIHSFMMGSKSCKHFDETGWRDKGKRHYVWLASCEQAAFYMIDQRRSS